MIRFGSRGRVRQVGIARGVDVDNDRKRQPLPFEKNGLYHRGQAAMQAVMEFSQEDLVARGWMASGRGEC